MSTTTRYKISGCCGKEDVVFETDFPLLKNHISFFLSKNFIPNNKLLDNGFIHIENSEILIKGIIGSNQLQIKCKIKDCSHIIDKINNLLLDLKNG